jgi:hypothetical protein
MDLDAVSVGFFSSTAPVFVSAAASPGARPLMT